jgi:branched-chain amino acid transport system substrate-binding protein
MKGKQGMWCGVFVATFFLVPLVGCFNACFAQQGITEKEILVGGFGPVTGPVGWLGAGARDGIQLAIDEINESGGINGRKLKFVHQGASSPAESLAAVKKLNEQQKVYMIFSASGSTGAEAAADYFRESGMPIYNTVCVTMKIREPLARNIFHGVPPGVDVLNEHYARSALDYKPRPKRIGVLVGSYAFPQAEWLATKPIFEKAGIEIATVQTYDLGDKDYTAQVVALSRAKPDMIVAYGQVQEVALAVKQGPERGLVGIPWWVGPGVVTRAFPAVAGQYAEGVRSVWLLPYYHGEKGNPMEEFEKSWVKRYGSPPEGRPAYTDVMGYGGGYIAGLVMKKAGKDLSWGNLIRTWESLTNVKISDFGNGAPDVIFPETYSPTRHQGNQKVVSIAVSNGTWRVQN